MPAMTPIDPAFNAVAITLADSPLTLPCRGVYIGTSGDLKVTMVDGGVVTFTGLAAGIIHPIAAKQLWATGSTAQNVVALY